MSPAAGKMRHRVTLEQPQRSSDGAGGFTTTWGTVATFWARMEPASASEMGKADTLQGVARYNLEFRTGAAPTIDSTMRVNYGGNVYSIEGIPLVDPLRRFTAVGLVRGTPS